MSIQEKVMAPGTFTVSLSATSTPNSIINSIDPWGQILIHSTRVDENTVSNQDMIKTARYVGVVQNLEYDLDSFQVSGKGTMVYLGDTDSRGLVVAETSTSGAVRSYTNDSLSDVLDRTTSTPYGILRTGDTAAQQAVRTKAGSIVNPTTGTTTYTGDHYLESTFKAVKYVCEHFDCEFYVDNEGYIYAGRPEDLFNGHNTNPDSIIIRQGQGEDPNIEGFIPAGITTGFNAEEYITKVELIPTGASKEVSMAEATVSTNEYKDLFDNNLKRIQVVKDASATQSNFQARANKALSEYNRLKKTVNVSLQGYDIAGSFKVGDKVFIYDPEVGFEDTSSKAAAESRSIHQVTYQGSTINPEKIRVVGMSYPVQEGMGVYYRNSSTGNIIDLTDYIEFETGDISLEIGDVGQSLSTDFSTAAAVINIGTTDEFTIPDQPTKPSDGTAGFDHSVGTYRDGAGAVKGFIKLDWTKPQNKNGTTILDGSHFLIQWRMVSDRDGNSILDSNDVALDSSDYQSASVDFEQSRYVIENLNIGFTYTVRLFAFDIKNHSSDVVQVAAIQIPRSSIAPNKPAKPENTFGSLASGLLRAQIVHKLAQVKDNDGNVISSPVNFTLDRDISHINVYGATSTFTLSYDSTNKKVSDSDRDSYYLGMLPASNGNIDLNIPVVGTINLDSLNLTSNDTVYYRVSAVNISGRESEPSDVFDSGGANTLIDSSHIGTAVITTAHIGTAQITDALIDTLGVNKLTSGSIAGKTFTLLTDSGTESTIESSGFSSGTTGFQIKSNGNVEFNSGNFRGDITGASGTFSGALSAATGTFSGNLSGAGGTFSGDLSAAGGTFSGDLSAAGGTFSGDISGANGTFTGDLSGADISGGTINIGSGTFQVSNAGAITATSGNIGGIDINTSDIQANYSSGTSGFKIETSGDAEFNSVKVRLGSRSTAPPSTPTTDAFTLGTSKIYDNTTTGLNLISSTAEVNVQDQLRINASGSATNPSLYLEQAYSPSGGTDAGFYVENDFINSKSSMYLTNGANNILHTESDDSYLHIDATNISVYGGIGSNGEVLGKTANGLEWVTAGGSHADSDHTTFLTSIPSEYLTESEGDSRYVQSSGHSHSGFITQSTADGRYVNETDHSHTGFLTSPSDVISVTSVSSGGFVNSLSYNSSSKTLTVGGSNTRLASITTRGYGVQSSGQSVGSGGIGVTLFYTSLNSVSDETLKTGITDLTYGLDWINDLRPISYRYDTRTVYVCETEDCESNGTEYLLSTDECDGCDNAPVSTEVSWGNTKENWGFSAQEIEATLPSNPDLEIVEDTEFVDGSTKKVLDYNQVIAPLVKAVQELSTQVSDLTARIEILEG